MRWNVIWCEYLDANRQLGTFIRAGGVGEKEHRRRGRHRLRQDHAHEIDLSVHPRSRNGCITIEDVRELLLPQHGNRVHLLYARGGQGVATVTPSD